MLSLARPSSFIFKRAFSVLASLILASAPCFAQALFLPVESTPYDNQMARVQPVLALLTDQPAEEVSLLTVNDWMNQLRTLPYRYSRQWQTPAEVFQTRRSDCKGKAIMLYEWMQSIGATNVRLVIGRHRAGDWFTHAWLEWETLDGNFLLDPTFNRTITRVDRRDTRRYIPLYAYEGFFKYRAVSGPVLAEEPPRAVASGSIYR